MAIANIYTGDTTYLKSDLINQYECPEYINKAGFLYAFSGLPEQLTRTCSNPGIRLVPAGVLLVNCPDYEYTGVIDILNGIETEIQEIRDNDEHSVSNIISGLKTRLYNNIIQDDANIIHYSNCVLNGAGDITYKQYGYTAFDIICDYSGNCWEIDSADSWKFTESADSDKNTSTQYNIAILLYDISGSDGYSYHINIPLGVILLSDSAELAGYVNSGDDDFYSNKANICRIVYSTNELVNFSNEAQYGLYIKAFSNIDDMAVGLITEKLGKTVEQFSSWLNSQAALTSKRRDLYNSYYKQKKLNVPYIACVDGVNYWHMSGVNTGQIV